VLASLVQNGNITLSVAGKKLDAANIGEATKMTLDQLVSFKHIEKPKGLPLAELVALFELLGLAEGLIRNENTHDEAVKQLRSKANDLTEKVVTVAQHVQTGLPCWGSELIAAEDREQYRQKLDDLKSFLEGLQAFNTPGKLKNFTKSILEIQAHLATLDLIKRIEALNGLVQELTALTGYLGTAAAVLPPQDPWRTQMETMRSEWRAKLMDPTARSAADFRQKINRALQKVKEDYKSAYFALHKKSRLGANEDGKKKELFKDERLERLKKLAQGVSLLPHASLTELQTRLAKVQTCFTLVKDDLESSPTCPHCSFRPQEENLGASGAVVLNQIDNLLDTMVEAWTKTLLENLDDPTAKKSIDLLPAEQKKAVKECLKTQALPEGISNEFVQGVQQALSGLTAVTIKPTDLVDALSGKGGPCTVEQIRDRFETYLQKLTQGKEPGKLRLVITSDESWGMVREDGDE
ncbi:MAG: DUF6079 family protein, partial [Betaproteobacteria bacterium]